MMGSCIKVAVLVCAVLSCPGGCVLPAQVPGGVKPVVGAAGSPGMSEMKSGSDAYGPWPSRPAHSPMMNLPFQGANAQHPNQPGAWNHGEAATSLLGSDHGGFLDWPDPGPMVLGTNVNPYIQPGQTQAEGWRTHLLAGNFEVSRFRGYLRNSPMLPGQKVLDAAFEVIVPKVRNPALRTVLVISTPPTFPGEIVNNSDGNPPDIGFRFGYGGWRYHNGLERNAPPTPGSFDPSSNREHFAAQIALLERNEELRQQGLAQYNVVSVRVMPLLVMRPARFQMQRNLEVVRAVQAMFADPGPTSPWRPATVEWQNLPLQETAPLTAVIEGGSLGGAVSLWTAVLFPSDFHGAFSSGACASIRTWVGEQEAYRYITTMSGFNDGSHQAGSNEILHYASALWGGIEARAGAASVPVNWSPFFHVSSIRAWKDGWLKRPVFAIVSDEDYVAMGVDSIPWLSGVQKLVSSGVAQHPTTGVRYFWSVSPKSSHFADQKSIPMPVMHQGPYPVPSSTWLPGPYDYPKAVIAFLHQAVQSRDQSPTMAYSTPTSVVNRTLDPWDHVLQPSSAIGPQPSTPLKLGNFVGSGGGSLGVTVDAAARRVGKSFGSGTHLGKADSSLVASLDGDAAFYTGSAEGVVTRFVVDPQTEEFVPQAMSEPLGFGAWAMCQAQADGSAMKEILVGTERGLHVLHLIDLTTISSKRDLPWELGRPRAMKSVNLVPGGYDEIVFFSENGALAVYEVDPGNGFTPLAIYGEPGIVDMVVLGEPYEGILSLALLSDRGHVVHVEWDVAFNDMIVKHVSPRLNGVPLDMEKGHVNGVESLVILMGATDPAVKEEIVVLNASNLQHPNQHRIPGLSPPPLRIGGYEPFGSARDLELVSTSGSVTDVLVLVGGLVFEIPVGGTQSPKVKDSVGFPPIMRSLDLVVHEGIAAPAGAQKPHEVVLATEAGYVCWFSRDEFDFNDPVTGAQFSFYVPPFGVPPVPPQLGDARPTGVNAPHRHCNRTTAATWGMEFNPEDGVLELIDQSGSRWGINGAGDIAFRHHSVGTGSLSPVRVPFPGPYRTLRRLPGTITSAAAHPSIGSSNVPLFPLQAASSIARILTSPLTPVAFTTHLGDPSAPWKSDVHELWVEDGYVPFPMAGDVLAASSAFPGNGGADTHVAWWGGQAWIRQPPELSNRSMPNWPNRVQGMWLDRNGVSTTILSWWSSAGGLAVPTAPNTTVTGVVGHDLRNQANQQFPISDAGALRLFQDPVSQAVCMAVGTVGGRLMVLQAGAGPTDIGGTPKQLDATTNDVLDFGTGGTALATATRGGASDLVDLYFGVMAHYVASTKFSGAQAPSTPADDITAAIVHVEYQGQASFGAAQLHQKQILRLDGGAPNRPKVFGVCGIVVGEIVPGNAGEEIVVGALDGHLLVYERLANGDFGALLYNHQVAGAVGMHNGFVIKDLDPTAPGNELYVAGSLGLWKWVRQ